MKLIVDLYVILYIIYDHPLSKRAESYRMQFIFRVVGSSSKDDSNSNDDTRKQ